MLSTEKRNARTTHIDKMETRDMIALMHRENAAVQEAVEKEIDAIAAAADRIAAGMAKGGRLFYVGCGTSGRLGVLDAAECPPTFGIAPERVIGVIAGGDRCLRAAAEAAEDNAERGREDLLPYSLTPWDTVVGISAAGGAAYVLAAIAHAGACGAATVALTANRDSRLAAAADIVICPETGAEVITGSTRLKAGTAQKLVLNMLSSAVMIKLGYVYENLMINLRPTNEKLRRRVLSVLHDLTGCTEEEGNAALAACSDDIRAALTCLKGETR